MEDDDDCDAPLRIPRYENAELFVVDTGVGWADLCVSVGPFLGENYTFTLVIGDPLDELRKFEKELAGGQTAHMLLRNEPGGVEVHATPEQPDGWVHLEIWILDYRDRRTLDFEAHCPAHALITSMRTKIGFLAREYEQLGPDRETRAAFGRD